MSRRLLSEKDIEHEYNIKTKTLQNWRFRNQGPPFRRLNNSMVRYDRTEFEDWLTAQPAGGQGA